MRNQSEPRISTASSQKRASISSLAPLSPKDAVNQHIIYSVKSAELSKKSMGAKGFSFNKPRLSINTNIGRPSISELRPIDSNDIINGNNYILDLKGRMSPGLGSTPQSVLSTPRTLHPFPPSTKFTNSMLNSRRGTKMLDSGIGPRRKSAVTAGTMTTRSNKNGELRLPTSCMTSRAFYQDEGSNTGRLKPYYEFEKPLKIIQNESAKFTRTMNFINEHEAIKKSTVSVSDRLNFMNSPNFGKFLTILKDRQLPKVDDENFYIELQAQLKEELVKRNRELKAVREGFGRHTCVYS